MSHVFGQQVTFVFSHNNNQEKLRDPLKNCVYLREHVLCGMMDLDLNTRFLVCFLLLSLWMELQSVSQGDFSSGIFHSRSVKKSTHFFFFFSLLILTELKTLYELSMHFFSCFPSSLHFTLRGPLSAVLQQPGRGRLPHCDAQRCPELGSDREENWEKNDVKSCWLRMDSGMRIAGRERLLLKQQVWKNANYRSHSKKHQV